MIMSVLIEVYDLTKLERRMVMNRKSIIICFVMIMLLCFSACGKNTDATPDQMEKSLFDVPTIRVDTRFGSVEYPAVWKEKADIKSSDEKIEVSMITAEGSKLNVFDISFGSGTGNLVGTINGGKVGVYVTTYEPDQNAKLTDKEKTDYYTMMEDLNYILQSLNQNCGMEYVLTK